jgi:hypothetical protein
MPHRTAPGPWLRSAWDRVADAVPYRRWHRDRLEKPNQYAPDGI